MIIDGKKIANDIEKRLKALPTPKGFLAAVQVGDDAATASFITLKEQVAKQLGVDFRTYRFPADVTNDDLRHEFGKIAAHKTCSGVMVELPMPDHLNWYYVLNAISPEKDVDVLSERALGAFYVGRGKVVPPAVGATEEVLRFLDRESGGNDLDEFLKTKTVAIVGLGLLIGRPVATWIMRRAKQTFLLRSTSALDLVRQADVIITGVGRAGVLKSSMVKDGAIVIDFGYSEGKGDFEANESEIEAKKIRYTPTPGGTGPILVAKLLENFYNLNSGSGEDK